MLSATLSTLATVLLVVRGWPQISRIAIHKNISGVSAETWTLILIVHCAWTVWGIDLEVVPLVVANTLAGCGAAIVLLTLARLTDMTFWRPIWSLLLSTSVSVLILSTVGSGVFSVVIMAITSVMVVPQVVKAYTSNPNGISPLTWWLAVASAATWSTYYVVIDRPILILANLVFLPCSVLILIRIYTFREPTPHDASREMSLERNSS